VEVFVLNQYGIENYFPQSAMGNVLGRDLSQFFPLAEDISVPAPMSYPKSKNRQVAWQISLSRDLVGADLSEILLHIAARAQELQDT